MEAPKNDTLDVTNIEYILDEIYPPENKADNQEPYAELLEDLHCLNINTREAFESLITKHLKSTMEADLNEVFQVRSEQGVRGNSEEEFEEQMERNNRNVYFCHVGLARIALGKEFGEDGLKRWRLAFLGKEKKPN